MVESGYRFNPIYNAYSDMYDSKVIVTVENDNDSIGNSESDVSIKSSNDNVGDIITSYSVLGNIETLNAGVSSDLSGEGENEWHLKENTNIAFYGVDKDSNSTTTSYYKAYAEISGISNTSGMDPVNAGDYKIINLSNDNVESYDAHLISNEGQYVIQLKEDFDNKTFTGSSTHDTIVNYGSQVYIDSGYGNDTVNNGASFDENSGNFISGLQSNNVYGSNTIIKGGDGDLLINNVGNKVSVNAGNGNNTVINGFYDLTLQNLTEYLISGQNLFVDYLLNPSDSVIKNGKDVEIITGIGNDIIINRGIDAKIDSGNGDDQIFSAEGSDNIINGGAGNDNILVHNDKGALIIGGDDNDAIILNRFSVSDAEIFAGLLHLLADKSVDIIRESIVNVITKNASLKVLAKRFAPHLAAFSLGWEIGSAIKDFCDTRSYLLELLSTESNIYGGKGNDNVILDALAPRVYHYQNGDGNDDVYGFSNEFATRELGTLLLGNIPLSTLAIESGNIDNVSVDGNDVILTIGDGSIKLVNTAGYKFNVREADGTFTTRTYGTNGNDLISNIDDYQSPTHDILSDLIIDGLGGNDIITNYAHDSTGGAGNDSIFNAGMISRKFCLNGNEGNDKIYGSSGHYRKRAVKAPCFSCGDETTQKNLSTIKLCLIIQKNF